MRRAHGRSAGPALGGVRIATFSTRLVGIVGHAKPELIRHPSRAGKMTYPTKPTNFVGYAFGRDRLREAGANPTGGIGWQGHGGAGGSPAHSSRRWRSRRPGGRGGRGPVRG